jgi:hypothetical protein
VQRLIAAILLTMFLYYSAGYYPVFRHRLKEIKREMKVRMARDLNQRDITRLRFSQEDYEKLKWKEPHEFYHGGSLYDVLMQVRDQDGFIIMHCLNDSLEKELYAHARKQAERNQSESASGMGFLKLITGAWVVASQPMVFTQPVSPFYFSYTEIHVAFYPDKPNPPPWHV